MNSYVAGNLIRSSVAFTNSAGTLLDPTTVRLSIRTPGGVVTTYLYGTDAEIVKTSTGNYYCDVDANEAGTWTVRWYSTGTGKAAAENSFSVLVSLFELPAAAGSLYTDTITDGMLPVAGVLVELSTDLAGVNRVYSAYTDANGLFAMRVDAGTYYRWIDREHYTGTQAVQVVVT